MRCRKYLVRVWRGIHRGRRGDPAALSLALFIPKEATEHLPVGAADDGVSMAQFGIGFVRLDRTSSPDNFSSTHAKQANLRCI